MKLTERETIVIYAGLTNALIDHIEGDFRRNIFNKQSLKFKSNAVLKELEQITDKLYSGDASAEAVEQHVMAGEMMLKLFRIGLQMSDMDDVKHEGLNTQLNILFKSYGIEDIEF
jgi:hypothetical protein